MKKRPFSFRSSRRDLAAFSLVEVALALGVVGFALVGIVGALPVAMNNERMSVAQTRAATVANVIFARFRAQPFNAVLYADDIDTTKTLDLNGWNTDPNDKNPKVVIADAVFDEVTTASTTDARRLHIYSVPPTGISSYKIIIRFNNSPPGTLAYPGKTHAQGNAIELSIYQDARPTDQNYSPGGSSPPKATDVYHFSTVIANRTS